MSQNQFFTRFGTIFVGKPVRDYFLSAHPVGLSTTSNKIRRKSLLCPV